jgi:LacI family transcriptional regulator
MVHTVYEVADLAGVSIATVSRVIHGSRLVHPDTRDRVLAVIKETGFVPDGSAQGLSRRRKDVVGLVALDRGGDEIDIETTSPLFMDELVHAVEAVLRRTEFSLLLTLGPAGEAFRQRVWSLSGKVDGLLLAEEVMPADGMAALARRIPVVVVSGRRQQADMDVVAVDNRGGVRALASHLVGEHGYRRIGFVAGPDDSPDARERLAEFRHAVAGHEGCLVDPVLTGDFSEASGSAAARALLGRRPLPDAVACANDQMAVGVLRQFHEAGVAVPVTGFDDIYAARLVRPELTTVRQPFRSLGRSATERLLARIDDRALPALTEILPTTLIVRASCGCGAAEHLGEGLGAPP